MGSPAGIGSSLLPLVSSIRKPVLSPKRTKKSDSLGQVCNLTAVFADF